MDVQDIVNTIANQINVDPLTTEKVVGTILSVLQHEAAGTSATNLFEKLPGSLELAQKYDVMATDPAGESGGLLGSLTSALGGALGDKAGALIKGISQLQASGLSLTEIKDAGTALIEQAKAVAGPKAVDQALADVPSLKSHLGL